MFFDVCDGMFLNYCWNEEMMINSAKLAGVLHETFPRLTRILQGNEKRMYL